MACTNHFVYITALKLINRGRLMPTQDTKSQKTFQDISVWLPVPMNAYTSRPLFISVSSYLLMIFINMVLGRRQTTTSKLLKNIWQKPIRSMTLYCIKTVTRYLFTLDARGSSALTMTEYMRTKTWWSGALITRNNKVCCCTVSEKDRVRSPTIVVCS